MHYAQDTQTTEYPCKYNSLANLRGRQEGPPDPNSFNFMQFGGKLAKSYNHMLAPPTPRVGVPPYGESWIRPCNYSSRNNHGWMGGI